MFRKRSYFLEADNIVLSAGDGTGGTVATDEVSSRHFQIVKLAEGGDGVATLVSGSAPLSVKGTTDFPLPVFGSVYIIGTVPISGATTGTVFISGTVPVSGSVTVIGTVSVVGSVSTTVTMGTIPAITGTVTVVGSVTTSATIGTISAITGTVNVVASPGDAQAQWGAGSLDLIQVGILTPTGTVAVNAGLPISGTLAAILGTVTVVGSVNTNVTSSGTVAINGGSLNVTIGTTPISGTVAVFGTLAAITGTVTVVGSVSTTASVVMGTVPAILGTVTVVGSVTTNATSGTAPIALQDTVITLGSLDAGDEATTTAIGFSFNSIGVHVTGTWGGQLEFESTIDGTNWEPHSLIRNTTEQSVNATTANGMFFGSAGAMHSFRVRASTLSSGAAVVTLRVSIGTEAVHIENPVTVTGTVTVVGSVNTNATSSGTVAISGGTLNAITSTVPVSGSVTIIGTVLTAAQVMGTIPALLGTSQVAGSVTIIGTVLTNISSIGTTPITGTISATGTLAVSSIIGTLPHTLQNQVYRVVAGTTSAALGSAGAIGDYLSHLTIVVGSTDANQVVLADSTSGTFTVFGSVAGPGLGTYTVAIDAYSRVGPWRLTTGGGASVLATGRFTGQGF